MSDRKYEQQYCVHSFIRLRKRKKPNLKLYIRRQRQMCIRDRLYPLNYSSKFGPWQFHSPPDYKKFTDLNSLTWNGKIKVINKLDGSSVITKNGSKDITCSVVNNFIHSTISKITYQVNDFQMGDSAAKSYSYRAYIDNVLSFSKGAKQQNLKYHGFEQDTAGKYDDVNKLKASNKNEGFKKRSELFCTDNYFCLLYTSDAADE